MLKLDRRPGQSIMINDDISIVVMSIQANGKVRLGIDAPREIPVYREEIYRNMKSEALPDEDEEARCLRIANSM